MAIPVIDLSPFRAAVAAAKAGAELPAEARAVVAQWRETFGARGFAQVTGHGVPDEVIERAYSAAQRFFTQPLAKKRKCDFGKGYGFGGFVAQGGEQVNATASKPDGSALLGAEKARPPDRVESMTVNRRDDDSIPDGVEGYKEAVHQYYDEVSRLLRDIMCITACSLDLPADFFDAKFFGEAGRGAEGCLGSVSLRLAYYPAWKDGEEPAPGQLRYGEHTDYTGFTILWQDHNAAGPQTAVEGARPPAGGLQVRMPGGEWVDCPPVRGAFTVNAGDLIQVWTNDVFLSNCHRVINPPPGDRDDRISMVFFTGPDSSLKIECLPTCSGPDRPARYSPITTGEHLAMKLAASSR